MPLDRVLCCTKSKIWLPDEFLTTIVGNCDKGNFSVTRPFTFPCMLMPNGNLYIEEQDGVEIKSHEFDLAQITCGSCGGDVEIREIDVREILGGLRQREITMKEKRRARESKKLDKSELPEKE